MTSTKETNNNLYQLINMIVVDGRWVWVVMGGRWVRVCVVVVMDGRWVWVVVVMG